MRIGRVVADCAGIVGEILVHVTDMIDQPADHGALFVQNGFQAGAFKATDSLNRHISTIHFKPCIGY